VTSYIIGIFCNNGDVVVCCVNGTLLKNHLRLVHGSTILDHIEM